MAWTCRLFTDFKKRVNSTKRPSGGTAYACRIKNNTDFKNPTFEIGASDLSDVSYMQFNGEYFYVTNVVSHRTGIWEVSARRDPMATYKADILQTKSLVMYGQTGTNVSGVAYKVPDVRIPISRSPAISYEEVELGGSFDVSPRTGTYILSAVGENNGVITYLLSQSAMAALVTGLNSDIGQTVRSWFETGTYPEDVIQAIKQVGDGLSLGVTKSLTYGNYAQCIKSCYWIPFSGFSGSTKTIYLGDYNTGVQGIVYNARNVTQSASIAIPWPYDDWRRNNCMLKLYLPFCGVVVIPVDKAIRARYVTVNISLDIVGGNIAYRVACGSVVQVCGANVAAPYAIGSSNVSIGSVMNGAMTAVGGGIQAAIGGISAAAGNVSGAGGAVSGVTSLASGIGQAITPQVQSVGSMGGIAGAGLPTRLRVELLYYDALFGDDFTDNFGYPCMRTKTPGSGYNLCKGFSVECSGTPDEIAEINAFFNTGAYVE